MKRRAAWGVLVVGLTVALALRFMDFLRQRESFRDLVGTEVILEGEVVGDVSTGEGIQKVKLKLRDKNMHGLVYFTSKVDNKISRGDRLTISGKMSGGFGAYTGAIYLGRVEKIARADFGGMGEWLMKTRERFGMRIRKNIGSEEESGLGVAYLLGLKGELPANVEEKLRLVGLTHLVVASGTHLGILTELVKKFFGRASRFAGTFVSLLFILAFGEMIGWTASITRATIVAVIGILTWYFGVMTAPGKVLVFAILLTLIIEPSYLFDLGWQLSFLSFFGVLIVAPRLLNIFYPQKKVQGELRELWGKPFVLTEMLIVSLATIFCVAPVLIYNFGYFSVASVAANLIISPTLSVAMGLSFLAGIPGWAGGGSGVLARFLLKFHLLVVNFFAEKPYFLFNFPAGDAKVFWAYLPLLIWLIFGSLLRAQKRRRRAEKIRQNPEKYLRWRVK